MQKRLAALLILALVYFSLFPILADQQVLESLDKIISVDLENVPLEEALFIIAQKGKFKLNYNRSRIPIHKKVFQQ